jgi:hypothetical protein
MQKRTRGIEEGTDMGLGGESPNMNGAVVSNPAFQKAGKLNLATDCTDNVVGLFTPSTTPSGAPFGDCRSTA